MNKIQVFLLAIVFSAATSVAVAQDKGMITTPTTPAATSMAKPTHAEHEAKEDSAKANAEAAEAACKKMQGAERTACKKEAEAQEKAAKADMKTNHK